MRFVRGEARTSAVDEAQSAQVDRSECVFKAAVSQEYRYNSSCMNKIELE
jgi:hypothetical protein